MSDIRIAIAARRGGKNVMAFREFVEQLKQYGVTDAEASALLRGYQWMIGIEVDDAPPRDPELAT